MNIQLRRHDQLNLSIHLYYIIIYRSLHLFKYLTYTLLFITHVRHDFVVIIRKTCIQTLYYTLLS